MELMEKAGRPVTLMFDAELRGILTAAYEPSDLESRFHLEKLTGASAGDEVVVLCQNSAEWWSCMRLNGDRGMIPARFIQLDEDPSLRVWKKECLDFGNCLRDALNSHLVVTNDSLFDTHGVNRGMCLAAFQNHPIPPGKTFVDVAAQIKQGSLPHVFTFEGFLAASNEALATTKPLQPFSWTSRCSEACV
jgi:hypothetical protein